MHARVAGVHSLIGGATVVVAGDNEDPLANHSGGELLANCEDTVNPNITITAREIAPALPIAAIAEEEDSIDVLQLSVLEQSAVLLMQGSLEQGRRFAELFETTS